MLVLLFHFWWTAFKIFHTHTTQRLRITAIHSRITFSESMNQCLFFLRPWGIHNVFHLLDIGSFLQLTGTLTSHGAPLSLLAGATHPWAYIVSVNEKTASNCSLICFGCEEISTGFSLWSLDQPGWISLTIKDLPHSSNSASICVIIKHVKFIPPVWEP